MSSSLSYLISTSDSEINLISIVQKLTSSSPPGLLDERNVAKT
jgi:hypothetical protein